MLSADTWQARLLLTAILFPRGIVTSTWKDSTAALGILLSVCGHSYNIDQLSDISEKKSKGGLSTGLQHSPFLVQFDHHSLDNRKGSTHMCSLLNHLLLSSYWVQVEAGPERFIYIHLRVLEDFCQVENSPIASENAHRLFALSTLSSIDNNWKKNSQRSKKKQTSHFSLTPTYL